MQQNLLKKSMFNVEYLLPNGDMLLYNTNKGTLSVLDQTSLHLYRNDLPDIQNLESAKNNDFVKNGFFVPCQVDEMKLLTYERQRETYDSNTLMLTIAPTLSCNMRCPYCFEEKVEKTMSTIVQDALIAFVRKKCEKVKLLQVTWYGGEPLLATDIIQNLSERIIALCDEKGIIYSAGIITNGYLLTKTVAEMLVQNRVSRAQVTIDGTEDIHNSRRILKSGCGSFHTIINNVEECKKLIQIAIRVNVDSGNYGCLDELKSYFFNELGWGENPVVYLSNVEKYTKSRYFVENTKIDAAQFASMEVEYIDEQCKRNPEKEDSMIFLKRKATFCKAVTDLNYVIDPEGYLYKCWDTIGNKRMAVGTIAGGDVITYEGVKWLTAPLGKKCTKCAYLPICEGGCPYQYIVKGRHNCGVIKESVEKRVMLAYKKYCEKKRVNIDAE